MPYPSDRQRRAAAVSRSATIRIPPAKAAVTLDELLLSTRFEENLRRAGCSRLGDLDGRTIGDLAQVQGLGRGSLRELIDLVRAVGTLEVVLPPADAPTAAPPPPSFDIPDAARSWLLAELPVPRGVHVALARTGLVKLGELHGMSEAKLVQLLGADRRTLRHLRAALEYVTSGASAPQKGLLDAIDDAIGRLLPRQRTVLLLRCANGLPLAAVAPQVGLGTGEGVRQTELAALRSLRALAGPGLRDALGRLVRAGEPITPDLLRRRMGTDAKRGHEWSFYARLLAKLAGSKPPGSGARAGEDPAAPRHAASTGSRPALGRSRPVRAQAPRTPLGLEEEMLALAEELVRKGHRPRGDRR